MSNAPVNIYVHVLMWAYVFISLEQIPRSRIAGLRGKFMLNFLKKIAKLFSKVAEPSYRPTNPWRMFHIHLTKPKRI